MSARPELEGIERLLRAGDPLPAYDAASEPDLDALEGADRVRLHYLRALALARAGATGRATEELAVLAASGEVVDPRLAEDVAALEGRLHKDRALQSEGAARRDHFALAAERYAAAFDRHGGTFPAVNAASMWLLAGDDVRAGRYAREVLAQLGDGPDATYWDAATRAEAHLVLGEADAATTLLADAAPLAADDAGARASTLRQLRLLCQAIGLDPEAVTAPLANRGVVHYCGHMVTAPGGPGRFVPSEVGRVTAAVAERFAAEPVGHAYGSLAAGADIIVAEAVLAAGAALHVVLPFGTDEFLATSVRPSGEAWVARFHRCLDAAASVLVTCDSGYHGDDALFGYASQIAMGQARNRASGLAAEAWQLAVWDGQPTDYPAGTAHDVGVWNRLPDARTVVIPVEGAAAGRVPVGAGRLAAVQRRPVRALLFGDLQGFSGLYDGDLGPFIDEVLTVVARVLDGHGDAVLDRNTWGDGLFVALTDASSAARCALDLQQAIGAVDAAGHGLPSSLRMRISAHAGPVLARRDPVRGVDTVFGRELTRAARIEPRTPPGEVYATNALAALLRLDPDAGVTPEYVGRVTTAKDFETIPMYVLRRA
jgi:adenylate cyclase